MWLTDGVIPFHITLSFQRSYSPSRTQLHLTHLTVCSVSWWAVADGHCHHSDSQLLGEVSRFLHHLIFHCCRVKSFIKSFWGFTDHGPGLTCHSCATSQWRPPLCHVLDRQGLSVAFRERLQFHLFPQVFVCRNMEGLDRWVLCLFGEILSLLPLDWEGIHLAMSYLHALWRESCTQGTVSVCKSNKQIHATEPRYVARTPLFIDKENAREHLLRTSQ